MSTFIIAEAGVNHNGSLDVAIKMIDAAKEAGVDCIKFQTFRASDLVSRKADKADYQKKQTKNDESQLHMLQKLELSPADFSILAQYCKERDILFLSTPFDFNSIDFLQTLNMQYWKIPSGEITNLPYLIKIAQTHVPIILSTGMSTIEEIGDALKVLREYGCGEVTLLHCTTEYPAPYAEVNLRAMETLRREFHVSVGYSDHTSGIEVPIAAVAMGATVIEKHFTLDRQMEGPDHKASLEPDELKAMVSAIRNIETALGSGEKKPSLSEIKNIPIARKSIIASRHIEKGELFSTDNITTKRPGNGISPMQWFEVLGKVSKRSFQEDELIEL
ncbi:N-acetylneuraminate synthase [Sphaerochaeta sp. PS]|uniref:N-acetylneuraminate synthase n=1 Tax=Sphaerochaeta sp. PS TaxID=3076336 RepID=UPI0028A4E1C2|nr:N-acetylneuraminate synthase [Sphaerochaeta sp. PS]MDT4763427.1 N-acetylneuraminate synthase [Sphaerochaeta sp. PS]